MKSDDVQNLFIWGNNFENSKNYNNIMWYKSLDIMYVFKEQMKAFTIDLRPHIFEIILSNLIKRFTKRILKKPINKNFVF